MNYGSLLFLLAQKASEASRPQVLQQAKEQLQLARKFFEIDEVSEKKLPLLAQICFLLGEITFYGDGNKEKAKILYEEALGYWPHPEAKEALKRYGGS